VLRGGAGVDVVECGGGSDEVGDPKLPERLPGSCEQAELSFECKCFGELFVYLQPKRSRRRELRFRLLYPFVDEDAVIGCAVSSPCATAVDLTAYSAADTFATAKRPSHSRLLRA
jgi:hypothetical protein